MIRIRGTDHIPAVIGDLRAMNRLTQRPLAEAVGTKQGRISEFETGAILPATPTLFAIAHAFGYDVALVPQGDA